MNFPRIQQLTAASASGGRVAFTLVEVLLILALLGILVAIVLPKTNCCTRVERVFGAKTQINNFTTALDMFQVDNGHYPSIADSLGSLVAAPAGATNWHQYMESIPLDPWGHKYIYDYPGQHNPNGFDLSSMGPDGKVGTKDDITNWQPN